MVAEQQMQQAAPLDCHAPACMWKSCCCLLDPLYGSVLQCPFVWQLLRGSLCSAMMQGLWDLIQ